MAGKSGSNGGSQRNTFGGTNLDAKLVRKMHLMAWEGPKNGKFWAKTAETPHGWQKRNKWWITVEYM